MLEDHQCVGLEGEKKELMERNKDKLEGEATKLKKIAH